MKLNMKLYTTEDGAMGGEYSYSLLCKLKAKGRQNSAHLPRPKPI